CRSRHRRRNIDTGSAARNADRRDTDLDRHEFHGPGCRSRPRRDGRDRPGRLRLMNGRAEEVLKKLAPSAYDMVFIDSEPSTLERMIQPSLRLLDTHGLLVIHQTLLKGSVADPVDRSPRTQAARGLLNRIAEREDLQRVLLPIGEGLLLLQKSP